jgi:hypothetical protein
MRTVPPLVRMVTILLLLSLAGCVSARLAQFSGFSQAGVAYVKASGTFIDEPVPLLSEATAPCCCRLAPI